MDLFADLLADLQRGAAATPADAQRQVAQWADALAALTAPGTPPDTRTAMARALVGDIAARVRASWPASTAEPAPPAVAPAIADPFDLERLVFAPAAAVPREAWPRAAALDALRALRATLPATEDEAVARAAEAWTLLCELPPEHSAMPAAALLDALRAHGVETFPPLGEPVRNLPAKTVQVIEERFHTELARGLICDVQRHGLRYKRALLAPARVYVSKGVVTPARALVQDLLLVQQAAAPFPEIPPGALRFCAEAQAEFDGLGGSDQMGLRGTQLLYQFTVRLDAYCGAFCSPRHQAVRDAAAEWTARAIAFAERTGGYTIFPQAGDATVAALLARTRLGASATEQVRFPDAAPADSILSIVYRGIAQGEKLLRPARIVVSTGSSSELGTLLAGARTRLLALDRPSPQAQQAASDLFGWIGSLESKDEAALATLARYAINKMQELGAPETDGVCEALSQYLKRLGINEIRVTLGSLFDGSFDPGKYERRRVPASAPSGTIVRVIQRGFLSPSGVPLQKAILAVAE